MAAGQSAVFGDMAIGPQSLRRVIETAVGLAGPEVSQAVRAARMIPALQSTQGFWSESFSVDPFGVARTLLGWLDALTEEGWDGRSGGQRLAQLAELRESAASGGPGRLEALTEAVQSRGTELRSLKLFEPRAELPALWRQLLEALEAAGTAVLEEPLEAVQAAGDLAGARESGFVPDNDGSLVLLRASGPLAAAETVAAWLASRSDLGQTVVVGADVLLDQALHRHGLPVSGAIEPSDNALLQVLPLVMQLATVPAHPQRALELLTLPSGPVPRDIARRLTRALHEVPSVGGDEWAAGLSAGLAAIEDPSRRARLEARLSALFNQSVTGDVFPAEVVRQRTETVLDWLGVRLGTADDDAGERPRWAAAMAQCRGLLELLKVSELTELPAPMLQRLLHDATAAAPRCPRARAEAGLHFIASPDGMLGPCDTVVWWGFTRHSAPAPRRSPFRAHEHRDLAEAGVQLPVAGDQALRNAERWNRPLLQCSGRLILVCPEVGLDGEALEVHPLWDEICSRMVDDGAAAVLVKDDLAEQLRVPAETRALPGAQHQWSIPAELIQPRKLESPSSLEKYLGCPLSWVLHYGGKVRPGESAMLSVDDRLLGSLVHEIVATVLSEAPWPNPEQAGDRASELFDELGPARAAQLFQPEWAREHAHARLSARESVISLLGQLNQAGLVPERVEQSREAQTFVGAMAGTADLVTGPSPVVIDLKWGGLTFRRQSLAKGSALQLAAYGELESFATGGSAPDGAYFILKSQRLLTTSTRFPGAERVSGPSPRETWLGAERAWKTCWAETERGLVRARGIPDLEDSSQLAPEESSLSEEGVLNLKAGCRFCDYSILCGREAAR